VTARGERVLVLGSGRFARRIVEELLAQSNGRATFGLAGERAAEPLPVGCRLLGPLADLDRILAAFRPHRIVVALEERRGRLAARPLLDSRVQGVVVEDGVDVFERLTGKLAIESLAPSSLLFGAGFRRSRLREASARLLSVLVAGVGLIVLSPLLALVALAIVLDSGRPVLFVQDRVGQHGCRFRLLKFRTMHPGAGPTSEWARDNGARITRVGRWLRRVRLDEVPQFLNVLAADMNLIGPRPHPVSNFQLFNERIPYYSLRSAIRPGVTGWAQVRYGYANNLAEETEKMRYDLYYLKHRSLALDLRILLLTLRVVALGRGAQAAPAVRWTEPAAGWRPAPDPKEAEDVA
jgi:lipopolysaccharide/colanic/teichoic acid biosynthesis glycosyltransferase